MKEKKIRVERLVIYVHQNVIEQFVFSTLSSHQLQRILFETLATMVFSCSVVREQVRADVLQLAHTMSSTISEYERNRKTASRSTGRGPCLLFSFVWLHVWRLMASSCVLGDSILQLIKRLIFWYCLHARFT